MSIVTELRGSDLKTKIADVCGHLNALHGELVGLMAEALDSDG